MCDAFCTNLFVFYVDCDDAEVYHHGDQAHNAKVNSSGVIGRGCQTDEMRFFGMVHFWSFLTLLGLCKAVESVLPTLFYFSREVNVFDVIKVNLWQTFFSWELNQLIVTM